MHLQPVFGHCQAYLNGVSASLFANGICLPSGTGMSASDLDRVVGCILSLAASTGYAAPNREAPNTNPGPSG